MEDKKETVEPGVPLPESDEASGHSGASAGDPNTDVSLSKNDETPEHPTVSAGDPNTAEHDVPLPKSEEESEQPDASAVLPKNDLTASEQLRAMTISGFPDDELRNWYVSVWEERYNAPSYDGQPPDNPDNPGSMSGAVAMGLLSLREVKLILLEVLENQIKDWDSFSDPHMHDVSHSCAVKHPDSFDKFGEPIRVQFSWGNDEFAGIDEYQFCFSDTTFYRENLLKINEFNSGFQRDYPSLKRVLEKKGFSFAREYPEVLARLLNAAKIYQNERESRIRQKIEIMFETVDDFKCRFVYDKDNPDALSDNELTYRQNKEVLRDIFTYALSRVLETDNDKDITEKVDALLKNKDGESDQELKVNKKQFRDLLIYALDKGAKIPRKEAIEIANQTLATQKKLTAENNVNVAVDRVKKDFGTYLNTPLPNLPHQE